MADRPRVVDWPLLGHALFGSVVGAVGYPVLFSFVGVGTSLPWLFGCAIVGGFAGMDWYRKQQAKRRS